MMVSCFCVEADASISHRTIPVWGRFTSQLTPVEYTSYTSAVFSTMILPFRSAWPLVKNYASKLFSDCLIPYLIEWSDFQCSLSCDSIARVWSGPEEQMIIFFKCFFFPPLVLEGGRLLSERSNYVPWEAIPLYVIVSENRHFKACHSHQRTQHVIVFLFATFMFVLVG